MSQSHDQTRAHYLFIDLETGGLIPERHSILQLAAVLTDWDLKVQASFMTYIKPHPELEITAEALEINQLKVEDLSLAPTEALAAEILSRFTSLAVSKPRFAGFNCKFDLQFLDELWRRQGGAVAPYMVPWLDIMHVAKIKPEFDSVLPNFQLATIAKHFDINISGAHDASTDLMITIEVARRLKVMPSRNGSVILETAKFSE